MKKNQNKINWVLPKKLTSAEQAEQWNARLAKSEYTTRRLTFGQYVNRQICDVPTDYLIWAVLNVKQTYWTEQFARELQRRDSNLAKS